MPRYLKIYIGVWGRGAQTGNSLKRGMCVCERVACVTERWRMLAGQINPGLRVYCCFYSSCPDLGLGFVSVLSRRCLVVVSVLSRFCLGFVSVLSRPASPKLPITQRVALSVYTPNSINTVDLWYLWKPRYCASREIQFSQAASRNIR